MKRALKELFGYIRLVAIVLAATTVINLFLFTFSTVRQRSMEETLIDGDVLVVERLSYWMDDPVRGDIVVFVEKELAADNLTTRLAVLYQDMWDKIVFKEGRERLVKRIVGLPGDEVDIRGGSVYINGRQLVEPYAQGGTWEHTMGYPMTVPEGSYFVMGDNREVSRDSRQFGFIDREKIEGRVMMRVYPFSEVRAF